MSREGWGDGVNRAYLRELVNYWTTTFDWRAAQRRLNSLPQFKARIDDFDIHFYHVRGVGPRPFPLLLTHGWPGSVLEFLDAIGPLTDPARFGGSPADAFDVVVPSLPGFGFSSKPTKGPIGPVGTARLWHQLMADVLHYPRFGAQGGDWGAAVTIQLAQQFPHSLAGIHLNAAAFRPIPDQEQTEDERAWVRAAAAYAIAEFDYYHEQQHKPQTVAIALSDSPLGAAAWIIEKFKVWSDSGQNPEPPFTKDQLITNLMIYLLTDSVGSAIYFYRGALEENRVFKEKIGVPTGFAAFPREMANLEPPRSWLARDYNLVHYTRMPRGGHFACFEQPDLFVGDVRAFFRLVRADER